ncbi:universal stress protein [Natrononativus amylolyticus]|uniref:universal stress protein n=1 Tax=Natrononativus amylolyticus TaxID=2963434 RepID=UPI0020CCAB6C|nr:universal stress protein [Natrononativus amylolyticus]
MYDTILVPVDGSETSKTAVDQAVALARTVDAAVQFLYVVDTGSEPTDLDDDQRAELRSAAEEQGRQALERAESRAAEHDVDATRTVREGTPYREVLEHAADLDGAAIVVGTHGRTGPDHVRLGSTAERILARADRPVVAVPPSDEGAYEFDGGRVLVAADGSDASERAAEQGFDVAETYDAAVYAAYVIDTTTYGLEDAPRSIIGLLREGGENAVETVAADGRDRGLSVTTEVLRGVPDEELIEYADGIGASLVVLGTRGQGGATGDVLGSTAARVLRRTDCPILTVR